MDIISINELYSRLLNIMVSLKWLQSIVLLKMLFVMMNSKSMNIQQYWHSQLIADKNPPDSVKG